MTHACLVEVAESFVDTSGQSRTRWRKLADERHTPDSANVRARELRDLHGAARIACPTFDAVAMRTYFGLKLIEPS